MARLNVGNVPSYAKEIFLKHQREAPVRVGAIAADLGVKVIISDLPLSISGMLSRDEVNRENWVIRVNRHEHKNRQRFTIAHEISHYVLHRDLIEDKIVDDKFYRSGLSEQREYEANSLAAEILMPWPLIKSLMMVHGTSVEVLANLLQVSEPAMHIRLGLPT